MKPKQIQTLQWLNMGSYPGYVLLSVGFNYDEIYKYLKSRKADQWIEVLEYKKEDVLNTYAFGHFSSVLKSQKILPFIFLSKPWENTDYDHTVLAHEILHVAQFQIDHVSNSIREYEAFAYLHSHLYSQSLNYLNHAKNKSTTKPRK